MSLMTLRYVLHTGLDMTDDKFLDSIVSVLAGRNQRLPMVRWLFMMNLFLNGTLEEKIDYVFKVYTGRCCTKTLKKMHVFLLLQECMEDDEEMIRVMKPRVRNARFNYFSFVGFLRYDYENDGC